MKEFKLNRYLLNLIIALFLCVGVVQAATVYGSCSIKRPTIDYNGEFGNTDTLHFWWEYNDKSKLTYTSFGPTSVAPVKDGRNIVYIQSKDSNWSFKQNKNGKWDIQLGGNIILDVTCKITDERLKGFPYLKHEVVNVQSNGYGAVSALSPVEVPYLDINGDSNGDSNGGLTDNYEHKIAVCATAAEEGTPLLNGRTRRCCPPQSCSVS